MAFVWLCCCYLASLLLLALAVRLISSPLRWSRLSYYVVLFILLLVALETLLVGSVALPFS